MLQVREQERSNALSHEELLAKAEQLQKASSLVSRAKGGLLLLLLKKPPDMLGQNIKDGKNFLDIVERDLDHEELLARNTLYLTPLLLDNRPRRYQPVEVLPELPDIRGKIDGIRSTLAHLEQEPMNGGGPTTDEITEAFIGLRDLGRKYTEQSNAALAEYEYGPSLDL